MSSIELYPNKLNGKIVAPRSKSVMQRALACAMLHHGPTEIIYPGKSEDDLAALEIIKALGAQVTEDIRKYIITGAPTLLNQSETISIHAGESGLSMRMFTPIVALRNGITQLMGKGSLLKRPMVFFNEVLPQLGVHIESNNGFLPLEVKGSLITKNIEIDGSLSSQFLTGLLLAYSAAEASNVTIYVKDLQSKPYIDLTLEVMQAFNMQMPIVDNYQKFYFPKSSLERTVESRIKFQVEGDWSGASFLLVAGALHGDIIVEGMSIHSKQADRAIMKALQLAGVSYQEYANEISVQSSSLQAFEMDATECPDLFPPLVALAAHAKGVSRFTGVHRLKHKESDRGLTLQQEFQKMGIRIEINGDEMLVYGGSPFIEKGVVFSSHHDHRIAMAVAVAALPLEQPIFIQDASAVGKSYPHFFEDLQQLGVSIKQVILS